MEFDWYSATVPEGADEVIGNLLNDFPHSDARPDRPMHGYTQGAQVVRGEQVLARAIWGGSSNGEGTHTWASGNESRAFAAFVRERFPVHRVTRADIAQDFDDPKAWARLFKLCRAIAKEYRLQTSVAGDFLDGVQGRTLYIGAPSSAVRLRLYEKGKQLPEANRPNWVRLELVVRPGNAEARTWLSTATPAEAFGASKWSAALAERLGRDAPGRVKVGTIYTPSDRERALLWLLKQYGGTLEAYAEELGGWDAVGRLLGSKLADIQAQSSAAPRPRPKAD